MNLTPDQKAALFQKNEKLLWKTVHGLQSRCTVNFNNEEDLYQECALVYLKHVNEAKTIEEAEQVPVFDMINAMCRYILASQSVKFPKTRTSDFSKHTKNAEFSADFHSMEKTLMAEPYPDLLLTLDFDRFQASLPSEQSSVVSLKRQFFTNREISRMLGVSDVSVTRTLNRVRRSYETYRHTV